MVFGTQFPFTEIFGTGVSQQLCKQYILLSFLLSLGDMLRLLVAKVNEDLKSCNGSATLNLRVLGRVLKSARAQASENPTIPKHPPRGDLEHSDISEHRGQSPEEERANCGPTEQQLKDFLEIYRISKEKHTHGHVLDQNSSKVCASFN